MTTGITSSYHSNPDRRDREVQGIIRATSELFSKCYHQATTYFMPTAVNTNVDALYCKTFTEYLIIGGSLFRGRANGPELIDVGRPGLSYYKRPCGSWPKFGLGYLKRCPGLSSPYLRHNNDETYRTQHRMGAAGQHTVPTTERLTRLRELMRAKDIAVGAVVVPQ